MPNELLGHQGHFLLSFGGGGFGGGGGAGVLPGLAGWAFSLTSLVVLGFLSDGISFNRDFICVLFAFLVQFSILPDICLPGSPGHFQKFPF